MAVTFRCALAGAISATWLLAGLEASAQGNACDRFWVERNIIYKDAGYCFKTARAIAYFGNGGCRFDVEASVPLDRRERARIGAIRARERALGCN